MRERNYHYEDRLNMFGVPIKRLVTTGWVDVRDMLPRPYGGELCAWVSEDGKSRAWYVLCLNDKGQWEDDEGPIKHGYVTHWQDLPPLPELPKNFNGGMYDITQIVDRSCE